MESKVVLLGLGLVNFTSRALRRLGFVPFTLFYKGLRLVDPFESGFVIDPQSPFFNESRVLGDVTYWHSAWLRCKLPGER